MSRLIIVTVVPLVLLLSACGSPTVSSAVSNMQSVIKTYDSSHPGSLADTGSACRKAYDDLGKSSILATATPTPQHRPVQQALRAAYSSARRGFLDCASGAASVSYPTMTRAEGEIAAANAAIARARRLER